MPQRLIIIFLLTPPLLLLMLACCFAVLPQFRFTPFLLWWIPDQTSLSGWMAPRRGQKTEVDEEEEVEDETERNIVCGAPRR